MNEKVEIHFRYRDVWRLPLVGHRHTYIPKHTGVNRGEGGKENAN